MLFWEDLFLFLESPSKEQENKMAGLVSEFFQNFKRHAEKKKKKYTPATYFFLKQSLWADGRWDTERKQANCQERFVYNTGKFLQKLIGSCCHGNEKKYCCRVSENKFLLQMYLDLKMMEMGKGTKSFLKFQVMLLSIAFQYVFQSMRISCLGVC